VLLNHRRALRLVAVLGAATVVLLVLVAWDTTAGAVQRVDDEFLELMVAWRVTPLVWVSKALSVAGSAWVNWPLRLVAFALLLRRRRILQCSAFLLSVVTSELLIAVLKVAYDRPRPPGSLVSTTSASFPSGHAVAGAVTAVGLVLAVLPPGRSRWRWELRAAGIAVAMSLSRAYLSAHWLSDVVTGGLLGTALAIGWPAVLQEGRDQVRRRRQPAEGVAPCGRRRAWPPASPGWRWPRSRCAATAWGRERPRSSRRSTRSRRRCTGRRGW
jgi:undecaprenyl-diphosphatase